MISFVSHYMRLVPGDVVSRMGTALAASTKGGAVQNVDLNKLGGVVEVEIGVAGDPGHRRFLELISRGR